MSRWYWPWVEFLLLVLTTCSATAATTKRVLMVFREASGVPANVLLEQAVRAQLRDSGEEATEIYTEYLDDNRFGNVSHHVLFRDYLRDKYRDRRPDVIVTSIGYGTSGLLHHDLIPGIPVVFMWALVSPPGSPGSTSRTNLTGVEAHHDYRGTLDLILQLQPEVRRIVVIGGIASSDRSILSQVGQASALYTNRLDFEYWTNQPMAELQEGVSRLRDDTAVLYALIFRDAAGRAFVPAEALELLLQKARVPTYVLSDTQIGSGAVGGSVVSYERLGACAGETARSILNGAFAADLPVTVLDNGMPTLDWRALRRWGISESRLPPGSSLRFRQPSFWEQYRWRIVALGVFCCLQTALIVGLLVNRAKRRAAESVAALTAELSSNFVHLPPGEVDREIEHAQRRVCECLGLDLSALWQWSTEEAGNIILTHLYRPLGGPPTPERMDAETFFPWCLQQVRAGRTVVLTSVEDAPVEAAQDKEIWRHYGVKSVVTFPLSTGGGQAIGALTFGTVLLERAWPKAVVERLRLVAQIIANALERKRADQVLRESEARLDLAADSAEAGLWEMDWRTRVFWATPRARALFGYAPDEIISLERFEASVHPDDRERVRQVVERALQGREPINVEYRVRVGDGSVKWIASRGRAEAGPIGKVTQLRGVSVDITDRKRVEESVRELSGRLIKAHEEERRRIARELHDDFSQRLALLSVEMELLGSAGRDAEDSSRARLEAMAGRVKELSSDLHRMAHELHPTKLEQLGLVAAARSFCRELSGQSGVRIAFEPGTFPREIPAAVALCLYRTMQEALHNVVRHSGAPEARVELRTEPDRACLTVRDAGRGFDVNRAMTSGGLGLSSIQERVRLLAGVLTVKSAPEQGTMIDVCVPLAQPETAR